MKYFFLLIILLLLSVILAAQCSHADEINKCHNDKDRWALETYSLFQKKSNEDSLSIRSNCNNHAQYKNPLLNTFDSRLNYSINYYSDPCTVAKNRQQDDLKLENFVWKLISNDCRQWLLIGK